MITCALYVFLRLLMRPVCADFKGGIVPPAHWLRYRSIACLKTG